MPVPVKQPAATSDLQRTFTDSLNPTKVAVFGNFLKFVNSVTRILRFISHLLLAGVAIQKLLRTPALEPNPQSRIFNRPAQSRPALRRKESAAQPHQK